MDSILNLVPTPTGLCDAGRERVVLIFEFLGAAPSRLYIYGSVTRKLDLAVYERNVQIGGSLFDHFTPHER